MGDLTAGQCEEIFHKALAAGDARGVEVALKLLAVRNPGRAQALMNYAKIALRITNPELRSAVSAGHVSFDALVNAYLDAEFACGTDEALTGMFSALVNDTDPAALAAVVVAAVIREAAR